MNHQMIKEPKTWKKTNQKMKNWSFARSYIYLWTIVYIISY